ncbi:MAG: hypothetical protein ACJ763_17740 [Bdellovibrionia bacterium]
MLPRHGALKIALLFFALRLALSAPALGADSDQPFSLPVGSTNVSKITEQDFSRVPNEVASLYRDEIVASGAALAMDLNWRNPYFGAGSSLQGEAFSIMIWGGLARIPEMTLDTLALITCHEIGHRIGGSPRQDAPLPEWSSSEGQADYFAASQCLKKYFSGQDSAQAVSKMSVDPGVSTRCKSAHTDSQEAAVCVRIALSAKSFIQVTEALTTEPHDVAFSTPDMTTVQSTLKNTYPSPQCRLDTFVAGALSNRSEDARPACWFKSQSPRELQSGSLGS